MDLISLETYKQAKAISSNEEDERLLSIIPSVSQLVKTYCSNSFNEFVDTDKVEFFSVSWDENELMTTESPILVVTEVAERNAYYEDYVVLVEDEDYVVEERTDSIIRLTKNYPKGTKSVRITYSAGYAEIPEDLNLAMIDLVHYYRQGEYKMMKSLNSATLTNSTTSSIVGNIGFPDHIKRVLDLYRLM